MSAADAQAEPTMEEILASIRRIISEDDAAPATAAPAGAAPDSDVGGFGDDVLELNAPVMEMPETVSPDFDFDALPGEYEPEQGYDDVVIEERWSEPAPQFAPQPAPVHEAYHPPPRAVSEPVYQPAQNFASDDGLVSNPIADVTSSVFAKLAPSNVFPEVFASGNSVEALVVAMLRPMLKEWLDVNLPRIVEDKVETEVARIARRSF